jgi:hypothetical protein
VRKTRSVAISCRVDSRAGGPRTTRCRSVCQRVPVASATMADAAHAAICFLYVTESKHVVSVRIPLSPPDESHKINKLYQSAMIRVSFRADFRPCIRQRHRQNQACFWHADGRYPSPDRCGGQIGNLKPPLMFCAVARTARTGLGTRSVDATHHSQNALVSRPLSPKATNFRLVGPTEVDSGLALQGARVEGSNGLRAGLTYS